MKVLMQGLRKFSQEVYPDKKILFNELAQGQSPHTLMITCSDSRIDPNMLTQTNPGELFVVRNAGNIVPPFGASNGGEEAAIEFAVDVLKVQHVVICGHSKCGAMQALISNPDLSSLPSVARWLKHGESTKRRFERLDPSLKNLNTAVEENVLAQVENLKTHPAVYAALREGRLDVFGWVYHFETGDVTIYDPESKRFQLSTEIADRSQANLKSFSL